MSKRLIGQHFETQALTYLKSKGLKCIQKNFYCRFGEIDLILLHQNMLVFVEVRYREKSSHGKAIETIGLIKQQKIKKAAQYFLLRHRQYQSHSCRFDVIAMDGENITWILGAFY